MNILIQLFLLVLGFFMLIKGADWFVEGASRIAGRFGIPQLVIGLTIVAMGTSAPEAAVSISSALKGSAEITIGNVVGSNILNVLLILGITSVIQTVFVQVCTIRYEIPFVLFITVLLTTMGMLDLKISRVEGLILLAFMVLYLLYLMKMAKSGLGIEETPETKPGDSIPKFLFLIGLGLVLIVWGSDITVDAATALAKIFGMSERLIGLTIVAFGTSLPELVTSATAALKGNSGIAVGNIVGSNIFNLLFVVGITALITPVTFNASFLIDGIVAAASMVLLFLCVFRKKKLSLPGGILLLVGYACYFFYLIH